MGNYKEKYEQALNRAKVINPKTADYEVAVKIFPELIESEDEKIKKTISDILLIDSDEIREILDANNVLMQDIDTWLEKQGKKTSDKIVEKARTEKQRVLLTETDGSANIDWDCRSLDDVKALLKCGLEFIRTIEANKQILTDSRFGGCSFRIPTRYDKGIKQGEQKPAEQSEEDEEIIKCLNNCLDELEEKNGWHYVYVNYKNVELNKIRNWLKSLKERMKGE